ncbi:kinetochore protein Spc25 isoform X1 [Drosophila novamexicana]|uniref:kinetochore protein Spc25 isoform X1 n=2 Tax=Drosophila novamexicana TaxID=47314 RepID=UPI0011E5D947|nr:kinetochore protein Spc25 isoform X1 [Drosophila novamexicana]
MSNQFNTRKRLMAMLSNEMRLEQEENAIAKQSAKFHSKVATTMENIKRQQRESEKLNALLNQRRDEVEKRNALKNAVRVKLAEEEQHCADMQAQLAKKKQERDKLIACVHTLSEATNTYINRKALPERVKGVAVSPDDGQWIPFDFDAHDRQGLAALWAQVNRSSRNTNNWRQLLSVGNSSMPAPNGKENANVSMTSVIEIDLTSPPSQK